MKELLKVENLTVKHIENQVTIVDDVSFIVELGKCIGILGESGSGKSLTCKAIMGILDKNFEVTGSVEYRGKNLLSEKGEKLRKLRGKKICMILQNPMTSFDPLYRIDEQIKETLIEHTNLVKDEINKTSLEILKMMQIRNPKDVLKKYPHQLSGGMLQRIMIGLALIMEPDLIIADEPTTAIDAITQYEVVNEFIKIKEKNNMGIIFISHDLGVIGKIADKIFVMDKGKIVDRGTPEYIFKQAKNIYTKNLIDKKMAVMNKFKEIIRKEG
ncbi:ABC transporter ATP-binding protein [Clostridium sp. SHJSY1]|uniref:ABC transporter ATP-binding protein n=1 Tax=Clostridium sp. SHJSY1 TaxID=2942483 RepID=UPI002873F68E|nr:ABC transporter ATP-binding protein [Clostridium sp. SHJSY1]MDS0526886.1 ABC transporter ATP-binding protein [Clostridium sp. SHJSY1]